MSKIKVLVLPSDRTGVGKFRSVEPHIFLQQIPFPSINQNGLITKS